MDTIWTYKYADINDDTLNILQQELTDLWNNYTANKTYTSCRFIFLLMDDEAKTQCPVLLEEITRLGLDRIFEGVGFLVVPPGCYTPLHIDNGVTITLSIPIINCENSYTVWYKDPERINLSTNLNCIGQDTLLNPENAVHELVDYLKNDQVAYFKIDPGKEMDRVESVRALWLNTAIPHRPEVLHDKLRVLATLRFNDLPNLEH
jgi:hypothetical protein